MQYFVVFIAAWVLLDGPSVWGMVEEGPNGSLDVLQQLEVTTDEVTHVQKSEQMQPAGDVRLTKEQVRAVIRARRERLRAEMKARRDLLRAEGEEIQQEIMAKKTKTHMRLKETADAFVRPTH